jgi:hypothetical protein
LREVRNGKDAYAKITTIRIRVRPAKAESEYFNADVSNVLTLPTEPDVINTAKEPRMPMGTN